MKAPTKPAPQPKAPSRDRSHTVVIDLGDLYGILGQLARQDARPLDERPNMSRTVRRLIHEEAQRRGLHPIP